MNNGDRVLIIGGMYKRYKTGTYLGKYGNKMSKVLIDGEKERNVWTSSIVPAPAPKKKYKDVKGNIVLPREEYNQLLHEIDELTATVE